MQEDAEDKKRRTLSGLKEKGIAFITASTPAALGAAAEGVVEGSGPLVASISGGILQAIVKSSATRAREQLEKFVHELAEQLDSKVDLEYLWSDEFLVEIRRFLELASKEVKDEKLTAARNHLIRKAIAPNQDFGLNAIASLTDRILEELPAEELAVLAVLSEPPTGTMDNERSGHLHTSAEVANILGGTELQAEILLQDLAGRKLILNFGGKGHNLVHGPKPSHVWGLSPMGVAFKSRIQALPDNSSDH